MTTEVQPRTSTWAVDPTHSIAQFAVKQLIVTTVTGCFRELEGTLHIDQAQPENSSVEAKIVVGSVDTNLERRDNHLRSDNYFSAELFPYMTFRSRRIERQGGEHFKLIGNLTIRGVTKEVELDGSYEGQVDDRRGNHRAAFTATAQISRKAFNVRWNHVIEGGGAVIGDNVKVTLHIEAIGEPRSVAGG